MGTNDSKTLRNFQNIPEMDYMTFVWFVSYGQEDIQLSFLKEDEETPVATNADIIHL